MSDVKPTAHRAASGPLTAEGVPESQRRRPFGVATVGSIVSKQRFVSAAFTALLVWGPCVSLDAAPIPCVHDFDCDDCNPCTRDECVARVCVNEPLATCESCDDGLFCNGQELCDGAGGCAPGLGDPCADQPGLICDERGGALGLGGCVTPCVTDEACDDGLQCTGAETCTEKRCVGGTNDGAPCTDDAGCSGGFCGGVCRSGVNPCGRGASCTEPGVGEVDPRCGLGRCCDPQGAPNNLACTAATKATCEAAGDFWLGVGGELFDDPAYDGECSTVIPPGFPNVGEDLQCPVYSGGLAPEGTFVLDVGPIGAGPCVSLDEVGDDYALAGAGVDVEFLEATTVRLFGSIDATTQLRVNFYDKDGRFVAQHTTFPIVPSEPGLITIVLWQPILIPAEGWLTIQALREATPGERLTWKSTDGVDVGSNDPSRMWVNGGPVTDGLPGVPDVLAFEIVGNVAASPAGACCLGTGFGCTEEVPWVCTALGGLFRGSGSFCQACSDDLSAPCVADADCRVCRGGDNDATPCTSTDDCPGGFCPVDATCQPTPSACVASACCDPITGSCTEVQGGVCSDTGAPCVGDADCPGGSCVPPCPAGSEPLGPGTDCDPNCCEQPTFSGGDDCAAAVVHHITVPAPGEPPVVVTVSGSTASATGPDRCSYEVFDRMEDPVWWEAFEIDQCAFVWVDLCCTDPVLYNAWRFITPDCPCGDVIPGRTHGAAIDPPPSRCPGESNARSFFAPLPPGLYYYPVFAGRGSEPGPYQLHITVKACEPSACCLDTTCTQVNELECETMGGAFQGGIDSGWGFSSVSCGSAPDGSDNPCRFGSCCLAPGECEDGIGPSSACFPPFILDGCMTVDECDARGGTFSAGVQCDDGNPCSACTIAGETNCQFPAELRGSAFLSDLTVPPNGVVSADDFVPQATTLTQVCVWGFYHDPTVPDPQVQLDCMNAVEDEFRVRVFADDNGLPGVLIGESLVTGANIVRGPERGTGFENLYGNDTNAVVQAYTLTLDAPIAGMVPGERHWLEVANNTRGPTETFRTCWWNWLQSFPVGGNAYCASGTNSGGVEDPYEYLFAGSRYIRGSGRMSDLAFCLGTTDGPLAFDVGEPVTASCWTCGKTGPPVCSIETQPNCVSDEGVRGIWNRDDPDCSGSIFDVVGLIEGDRCYTAAMSAASSVVSCGDGVLDPGEQCDDGNQTPGDGCDETCRLECPVPFDLGDDQARVITDGLYAVNTNCADTDGPPSVSGDEGFFEVSHDIWFHYTTTCTGKLVVNACPTQTGASDNVLAIYHEPDSPTECVCPEVTSVTLPIFAGDELCNGIPDAGAGGVFERSVNGGECYTIRVTNFFNASGPAMIDVDCIPNYCQPASPVEPEMIPDEFGVMTEAVRNRFLTFRTTDVGKNEAIRVTFLDLPPPYDVWEGRSLWVTEPMFACDGFVYPFDRLGCPPESIFYVAKLDCGDPLFRDWSEFGLLHVFHEGIVPGGTYRVEVFGEHCLIQTDPLFAPDIVTMTTAGWGDVIGNCAVLPCTPPDGTVNISDPLAILQRFVGDPAAIRKTRADLEPACVDLIINISDVLFSLQGFSGVAYPFSPSAADPCDATCRFP